MECKQNLKKLWTFFMWRDGAATIARRALRFSRALDAVPMHDGYYAQCLAAQHLLKTKDNLWR
jgi:hypothetical protein